MPKYLVEFPRIRAEHERQLSELFNRRYSRRLKEELLNLPPTFYAAGNFTFHGNLDRFNGVLKELYLRGYELGLTRSHLKRRPMERRKNFVPGIEGDRRKFLRYTEHVFGAAQKSKAKAELKTALLGNQKNPKIATESARRIFKNVLLSGFAYGLAIRRLARKKARGGSLENLYRNVK